MGFRFRKSVKVAPGVRLNVGKRGVSATVGGRKGRVNVSKRGTSVGASIPGTGVSYNKRIGTSSKRKTHTQTQEEKQQQIEEAHAAVEEHEAYIHRLTSLHEDVTDRVDWEELSQKPAPFSEGEEGPHVVAQKQKLANYKPTWRDKFFNRIEARKRLLEEGIEAARQEDDKVYKQWEEDRTRAKAVLAGDRDTWTDTLTTFQPFHVLEEFGCHVTVSLSKDEPKTVAEIHIEDHDIVPATSLSVTKTGKLSEKKLTKTNYYQLHKKYVCSCTLKAARELFALLPIEEAVIHVYAKAEAEETAVAGCILSMKATRKEIEQTNVTNVDSSDAMEQFHHEMKFLKTKGFKYVEEV